jgi:hypothetical protein
MHKRQKTRLFPVTLIHSPRAEKGHNRDSGPIKREAYGTKRTSISTLNMSAFGGKVDIADLLAVSTNDPKRT